MIKDMQNLKQPDLYDIISKIIVVAKAAAYKSTNTILLRMYWEIGKLIVENEQNGNSKADYGKGTLRKLASQLTFDFGKGFDESNLRNMRNFYLAFEIWDAVRPELSCTH